MTKNECGKTRKTADPYEVWTGANGFEWRVLKKYQNTENEAKNPHARWFCAVKSNFTYGEFELGDVYVSDVRENGIQNVDSMHLEDINWDPNAETFRLRVKDELGYLETEQRLI